MSKDPIVTDLPEEYTHGIGRVAIQWAFLEHAFRVITYRLLDLDPKRGRIAVRDPRPKDCVKMIRELIELSEIKLPDELLDDLPAALEHAQSQRDMILHGIWVQDSQSGEIKLIRSSGNWRPNPKKPGVSRKMRPEGVPTTPADLDSVTVLIQKLIALARRIYAEVDLEMKRTSSDISQPQSQTQDLLPASTENTPEPRPESSGR